MTEAHNVEGNEFGEERLVDVLKQHHGQPAGEVLLRWSKRSEFARGAEQYDDVTALVVRYSAPGPASA